MKNNENGGLLHRPRHRSRDRHRPRRRRKLAGRDEFAFRMAARPLVALAVSSRTLLCEWSHWKQVPVLIDKEEIHFRELHVPKEG